MLGRMEIEQLVCKTRNQRALQGVCGSDTKLQFD